MSSNKKRIALLIDAENADASHIAMILAAIELRGSVLVRRAYRDWSSGHKPWEAALPMHAIQPVQQFSYVKGKNAVDIAIVVDAMDLFHGGSVDAFALVSSDSDFTPLAMRLVSGGAEVHGFGKHDTADALKKACSSFTPLGKQSKAAVKSSTPTLAVRDVKKVRGDKELHELLRIAVTAATGPDGWANLSQVRTSIENKSFHQRNYGYATLRALVAATEIFEIRQQDGCQVRHKRARAA